MVAVQLLSWKPLFLPSQASSRNRFPSLNRRLSLNSLPSGAFRFRGTFKVNSQRRGDRQPSNANLSFLNDFSSNFHRSLPYKAVIGCVPLYALFRIMQKMFQELPGLIGNSVGASCLPFACASNSLNKPTPLNLDFSIPSFNDIKWSTARFLYLFNIQLEKNIGTFLVALLLACISFVIIGGFLFSQFRKDNQPLEECFWEAWACLISSSTHLRVINCFFIN